MRVYLVGIVNPFLGGHVVIVISQTEETIVVHQVVVDITELFWIVGTEESGSNLIDNLLKLRIGVVVVEGIVSTTLQILDLIDSHTEDENVIQSHFFSHFDVSSIQGTNRQSSV